MNEALQKLVQAAQDTAEPEAHPEDTPRIHVSEALTAASSLYEWLRNHLEFKEEHLLRRNAIERILRRSIFLGVSDVQKQADQFLRELVRSAYFPNDTIPESKGIEVAVVLARYIALLEHIGSTDEYIHTFLLQLASVELEHILAPSEKLIEEAFVEFAYEELRTRILWKGALPSPEHEALLFVAIHKTILRSDNPTITWTIFSSAQPDFITASADGVLARGEEIVRLAYAIREEFRHPALRQYLRAVRPFVPAFTILHDILVSRTSAFPILVSDPAQLGHAAVQAARERSKAVGERLSRMATRATIYVFLTKMIVALAIELPLETKFFGFRLAPFLINIGFPPALMFLAAKSAIVPGEKNIKKIGDDVHEIVYPDANAPYLKKVRIFSRRRVINDFFFFFASIVFSVAVSFFVIQVLFDIGFSVLSIGVFFFFLAVVSFFAWRIRQPVRDISAVAPREDLVGTFIDLASFPLLLVGRFISEGLAKINISLLIFDLAIEAPFKLVLNFVEEWTRFLREKREELLE